MTAEPESDDLQHVERGYVQVIRVRTLLGWLPLVIGATVLDRALLDGWAVQGALPTALGLSALISVVVAPPRIWQRLRYRLHPNLLQVLRGWLFHTDTIVPFVRVQHIDVKRGPMDKLFGTASLVVHTAGTHNSIVTLPGLSPTRAADIRDDIRADIRTDAE